MLSDETRARIEFEEMAAGYSSLKKYNLSIVELHQLYEHQEGCCAFCQKPLGVFAVDHDHRTGLVRGLLHPVCNTNHVGAHTVWSAQDLLEYLRNPPAQKLWIDGPAVEISGSVRTNALVRAS